MDDELLRLVRQRLGAEADEVVRIDRGWDSVAFDVDDMWIVRVPRRPEVREQLLQEARLTPLLEAELPVPVPVVSVLANTPELFAVGHRKLHGDPLQVALRQSDELALAHELGSFLAALHCSTAWARAGLPAKTWADWRREQSAFVGRCAAVLRLLDEDERRRAGEMLERYLALPEFDVVLIHGDLGPEHVLCGENLVAGVIDWSDARLGDPALDFAWLLHGAGAVFGGAVLEAYVQAGGCNEPCFQERARWFHQLGPWHEVLFGLERGRDELVKSGLAGVCARLP